MHVGGPRVNIRCAAAASGDMLSRELHLANGPWYRPLFAPRRGTRSIDGELKPPVELSQIAESHWYWWYTAEQAITFTPGVDCVEDLLPCDTPETTFYLAKQRAVDYRQALHGASCYYFSPRSSLAEKNRCAPTIHLAEFAAVCLIIRRCWPGILEASSRLDSGRVIYNAEGLSSELRTHNPRQRSGSVAKRAEKVDWDVHDCRTFFCILKVDEHLGEV